MGITPGIKTSEFYVTILGVLTAVSAVIDTLSKDAFVSSHPALATGITTAGIVVSALLAGCYVIGRSLVKSSTTSTTTNTLA